MRKFLLLGASVALLSFAVIEEASAQRGGGGIRGGGGFRGGMVGGGFRGGMVGGGFRGGMVGGGFRGGMVGGGYRGAAIGGGFRGMPVRAAAIGGYGYRGAGLGRGGYGYGRRVAWAGRPYYPYHRYGYRRGWGWPVAAGLGVGLLATSAYYNSCWRYDGWQWVNVCYGGYYSTYY